MHREDNNGFINFPLSQYIDRKPGKTHVYLIAFTNGGHDLSNVSIDLPGNIIISDISGEVIDTNGEIQGNHLVNGKSSVPLLTSICVGWKNEVNVLKADDTFWSAGFRDLSSEGRKLYYSIKKLHNNKEVRILTIVNAD